MTSLIKRQGYSDASTAARGALRCKVTSGDPVIAAIAGDDIYVDVRLPRASISIDGSRRTASSSYKSPMASASPASIAFCHDSNTPVLSPIA